MEAQEALRDVQLTRERTADRLVTPRWYHPTLGLAVAAVCLAVGLGTSPTGVAVMLVVCLLAAATMGALARTYRDRTNVWVGPAQARGSARHWWIGYVVVGGAIIVGGILIAVSFRRGEGHDALPKILWPMAGAIVIGGGAALVGILANA